jgi:HlyD family secretion protein
LGHNFRVFVKIIVWQSQDVTRLPLGALFRSGDDWAVFVVEDGRARLRPLEIGHRNERNAEVLAGVSAGAAVVLYPSDAVRDGVAVTPRAAAGW